MKTKHDDETRENIIRRNTYNLLWPWKTIDLVLKVCRSYVDARGAKGRRHAKWGDKDFSLPYFFVTSPTLYCALNTVKLIYIF